MHFSRMKGRRFVRGATATVLKRAQFALLLCGIVGIASKLLVSAGTMASPNATGSSPDEPSRGQTLRKAPPGMVWIPGSTFLIGTNDKESFPNERPAHFVRVQGFWMDEHDVTDAEFSKFVEAGRQRSCSGSVGLYSNLWTSPAQRSFGLVALGARSELAPSRRPCKLYKGKRKSSSRSGLLARRGGLCPMGG